MLTSRSVAAAAAAGCAHAQRRAWQCTHCLAAASPYSSAHRQHHISSSSTTSCSSNLATTQQTSSFAALSSPSAARLVVACSAAGEGGHTTVELEVMVDGMKCGGCSSRVEAALKAMEHVKGVQVDLETKLATVEVEAATLMDAMDMLPTFVKTIQELGFQAEPHLDYQA